jgi:acetoin utilization protein AcuB
VLVKDRMTPQPLVVVTPETPITEVQRLMQEYNIRHLPVVADGKLVGLLNRETMLKAVPWSATSLSALEIRYILSKVKASKVMERDVITTTEDVAVEEAARIMVDHKVSCLPVLREGVLVGIITDTDLLSTTMEMLGARQPGLRLAVTVPHQPGEMARLSTAIAGIGGNLTAFGSWEVKPAAQSKIPVRGRLGVVLKVDRVSREQLIAAVEKLAGVEILDVRGM